MTGACKVAVLGAGGMGGTVIEHLRECEQVTEIIAHDLRAERVAELKEKYGIHATTNVDEILQDAEIKMVFVTASNEAHYPLVMAALAAGKAVMCEKPIADTLEKATEMVEKAEALGLFFQIGFELRYSKLYTTVKEWIDAGLLGTVVNTQCTYTCSEFHKKGSWRNRRDSGGMFGEKLSHYVDLPRWWIGSPVKNVYSVCSPKVIPYYEVRDNYHTVYRFDNGAVSELSFNMAVGETDAGDPLTDFLAKQKDDGHELRLLITGTAGAAATDVFRRTLKRWAFGDSPTQMTSTLVENLTWDKEKDHDYFHSTAAQTHDIVQRVINGQPPKTPARDALETMRLVFAAEESADTGKVIEMKDYKKLNCCP